MILIGGAVAGREVPSVPSCHHQNDGAPITSSWRPQRIAAWLHTQSRCNWPDAPSGVEASRMNIYAACVDWCLPWKRVFRLGLLLQSGAPFGRSSQSWFVLLRIVGPDRSGRGHRRASSIAVKCGGCMSHILVLHYGTIDSTASPPFEYCRRPPYLQSIILGRDLPFAHITSFGCPCPPALLDLRL